MIVYSEIKGGDVLAYIVSRVEVALEEVNEAASLYFVWFCFQVLVRAYFFSLFLEFSIHSID